jgi:hypothetical protein
MASLPRGVRGEVVLAGGRVRPFRGSVEVGLAG